MMALASVDLISESVAEDLKLKQDLFSALAQCCRPDTILTTDTSGLPISEIATGISHPARFAGMHFANPPQIMLLAEIIKGEHTSEATCELLIALAHRLGKYPIFARQDVPGLIAARLQCALIREALHLLEAGIATPADIDAAVKHGLGLRWAFLGPLELVDLGGVDVRAVPASRRDI
jgi:3-hydroxybutyryl-CoA dehydrogenase